MSQRMTASEVVPYLREKHGIKHTVGTMEAYRSSGRGPRYFTVQNRAFYLAEDVDEWAKTKTSPRVLRASELKERAA